MNRDVSAFPGKVDTGFPKENATSVESRALSDHAPSGFVNPTGKRSSIAIRKHAEAGVAPDIVNVSAAVTHCR
jgi:hypothetical protein